MRYDFLEQVIEDGNNIRLVVLEVVHALPPVSVSERSCSVAGVSSRT